MVENQDVFHNQKFSLDTAPPFNQLLTVLSNLYKGNINTIFDKISHWWYYWYGIGSHRYIFVYYFDSVNKIIQIRPKVFHTIHERPWTPVLKIILVAVLSNLKQVHLHISEYCIGLFCMFLFSCVQLFWCRDMRMLMSWVGVGIAKSERILLLLLFSSPLPQLNQFTVSRYWRLAYKIIIHQ